MNKKDLLRANIMKASKVVILSPQIDEIGRIDSEEINQLNNQENEGGGKTQQPTKLSKDEEDLLDAKTIFKYKAVSQLKPDIEIVTELVSPQNLIFLINNQKDYGVFKKYGYDSVTLNN